MIKPLVRLLIQEKLAAGRLPSTSLPRVWSGRAGNGETCDGCGKAVTKDQRGLENLDAVGSRIQFHVACFHVWDVERQLHAPEPSRV